MYEVQLVDYEGDSRDTMVYYVPSLDRSYQTTYKGYVVFNDTYWFDRGMLTNEVFVYKHKALTVLTGILAANFALVVLFTLFCVYKRGDFKTYWQEFENREMPDFVCPERDKMYVHQGRVIRTYPDRRLRYFEVCDPEQRVQRFEDDSVQVVRFGTGPMPQISWHTWNKYVRRSKLAPRRT